MITYYIRSGHSGRVMISELQHRASFWKIPASFHPLPVSLWRADRWALPLTEIIQLVLELNHSFGQAQCDSCGDIRWTCNWQHQQLTALGL